MTDTQPQNNTMTAQQPTNQTQATSTQASPAQSKQTLSLFQGHARLFTGTLAEVLHYLKTQHLMTQPASPASSSAAPILIFDNQTGRQLDFDLSGTPEKVQQRYAPPEAPASAPASGPGRPKLGVVAREVTLLPRHWEWLETQRGGASAALRRLIDEERKRQPDAEATLQAQTVTDRFLGSIGGDLPGYEEATRALYARNQARFQEVLSTWPDDLRAHALELSSAVFEQQ